MIYVFDSSPLIDLFRYYYLKRFPTLWSSFDNLVSEQRIISVKEVRREVEGYTDRLSKWANSHGHVFSGPSTDELKLVTDIFKIKHFQAMIRKQELLEGKPVADPFVIAKANAIDGCVVTQENLKNNAAKIPNVCKEFEIPCINLEKFMEKENWTF